MNSNEWITHGARLQSSEQSQPDFVVVATQGRRDLQGFKAALWMPSSCCGG
jgi:hypothetical protein